jgi:glycosyltransferase involved in cell wall biosynthesis
MRQPDVSCIIPTRNRAGFVGDAIESALGQSHDSIEVIVVDDRSTDATPSVLARFSGRIRVLRTTGVGVAGSRNAALAVARGRYVAFLDSDDVWYRDKTAVQVALMDRQPEVGLSFTDHTVSEQAADGSWQVVGTRGAARACRLPLARGEPDGSVSTAGRRDRRARDQAARSVRHGAVRARGSRAGRASRRCERTHRRAFEGRGEQSRQHGVVIPYRDDGASTISLLT